MVTMRFGGMGVAGASEKGARNPHTPPTPSLLTHSDPTHDRAHHRTPTPPSSLYLPKLGSKSPLRVPPPSPLGLGVLSRPKGVRKAGRGTAAGGQAVTLGEPRAARLPASLGGAHVQLPDGRAPSSSSSARSSSSCTSSTSSASASSSSSSAAAASAGRPDCGTAAVVTARLRAAGRLLGPAQRPALQHLPVRDSLLLLLHFLVKRLRDERRKFFHRRQCPSAPRSTSPSRAQLFFSFFFVYCSSPPNNNTSMGQGVGVEWEEEEEEEKEEKKEERGGEVEGEKEVRREGGGEGGGGGGRRGRGKGRGPREGNGN